MRSSTTAPSTRRSGRWTTSSDLCGQLREPGISVCVDLVLNHTAAEHEWAGRARGRRSVGDAAMYRIYPDRTMPDRYEATLPEVFPTFAPGNFTQIEDGRWVWTTFNAYQWDLDWSNPQVFVEMTDVLLSLANRGVDVFRLDAVAFMWKRLGHELPEPARGPRPPPGAAGVRPDHGAGGHLQGGGHRRAGRPGAYLGLGRHHGRVSDMAYHNSLMVQFWSSLAAGDTRLMTHVLREFPRKPVDDRLGDVHPLPRRHRLGDHRGGRRGGRLGRPAHRAFLSAFYTGAFPGRSRAARASR